MFRFVAVNLLMSYKGFKQWYVSLKISEFLSGVCHQVFSVEHNVSETGYLPA
jgi:hypothetical protein